MKFEIIPKQDIIPVFDSKGIKIKYIRYDPLFDNEEYEEEDITETLISWILEQIPDGIEVLLYMDSYGEEDFLEVLCDGEWLALCRYTGKYEVYYSYNHCFAGTEELSPLESGGQSPICTNLAKMLASVTCLFFAFQQKNPQNTQERHPQKED